MNALAEIKTRFTKPLAALVDNPMDFLTMIRAAGDPKFGDYQANFAMPLGNRLKQPPREIAQRVVDNVELDDLCQFVEIAGPGFINLTLHDRWIQQHLVAAMSDSRLGVKKTERPLKVVVDYSSPNVAKPMHVGHIRSTVIGAALANILRFVGHEVVTDNHLGDWGTQFGMIIYGFKHFVDADAYKQSPVSELGRIYKKVRSLMDYHAATRELPVAEQSVRETAQELERIAEGEMSGDKKKDKKQKKLIANLESKLADLRDRTDQLRLKIEAVDSDPDQKQLADKHAEIENAVLQETAQLHEGDPTNRKLWDEFLPFCREDIQRIYKRLGVEFDYELGESFFQDQLAGVVADFEAKGFARESEGAICVFMDGYDTPMIIQKKDGAFLYATTDLATIKYRLDQWNADAALYVVDHRQHQHFEKLFDAARLWGYDQAELTHVSFGTVLGDDGRPFKTRSGDTVGLEGLLDEAEARALVVATDQNPDLSDDEKSRISQVVGIGALKYADLSQNRASDYKFSYDKMLALKGNTATYLQYTFARVQGIFRKLDVDVEKLREAPVEFQWESPVERQLAVKLIRFGEALDEVLIEYKPNILCNYLFDLTQTFFQFYDQCSVKDAETESLKQSRLQLCDLTARTIKTGLGLLGIGVLDQM
jgi:arginyl-tRNA synthetase